MSALLTVFTPTYNREETLPRLYQSLRNQTNFNFEWVIVDDGSSDNTEEMIKGWQKEDNFFKIFYQQQLNGGKHRAINRGLDIANGRIFFIVDSDDFLLEDAIQKIIENEKSLPKDGNIKYAGIAFNKGYQNKKLVGTTFKGIYIDATSLERKKYHITGDKAEVFYTDVLKNNKFPEFENEKFITEALVWNRIAKQNYKFRWFQDIIYLCEYRQDGLTKAGDKKSKESPRGLLLFIQESIEVMHLNLFNRLLKYAYYSKVVYENNNISQAANELKIKPITLKVAIQLRKIGEKIRGR